MAPLCLIFLLSYFSLVEFSFKSCSYFLCLSISDLLDHLLLGILIILFPKWTYSFEGWNDLCWMVELHFYILHFLSECQILTLYSFISWFYNSVFFISTVNCGSPLHASWVLVLCALVSRNFSTPLTSNGISTFHKNGWRVRSWVQNPLGVCVNYQSKKEKKKTWNFKDILPISYRLGMDAVNCLNHHKVLFLS